MYRWSNSGTIYVSQTKGDDRSNGFAPVPTDSYDEGPVRTLDRALSIVKDMRCVGNMRPMVIALTEDYYLENTVVFTEKCITLTSYGGRKRLIGGIKLDTWKKDCYNGTACFSAQLPGKTDRALWDFSDLIVNGKYAQLTRYPKTGLLRAKRTQYDEEEGKPFPLYAINKWFEADPEDLKKVPDILDAMVNYYHFWVDGHTPVEAVDWETGAVTMKYPTRFGASSAYGSDDGSVPMSPAAFRYYFSNVGSQFGVPGEWFLQRQTGTVYYVPEFEDCAPEQIDAYAPVVSKLLEIQSDDVRIQNLELMCSKGDYVSRMINPVNDGRWDFLCDPEDGFAYDPQSVCFASGAIIFDRAQRGGIFDCHIHHVGVHGVEIKPGSRFVRLEGNTIEHICAGGISIWGGEIKEPEGNMTFGCVVRKNRIAHCGQRFEAGNGILLRHASNNEISENEVCHIEYSGITVGWVWGYADSSTYGNIIRGNHIHHIGADKKMSDKGGIYLLGKQQGTIVAENRIHDINTARYGAWGIYLDEGTSYVTVENNVVFDTFSESLHQHYGSYNVARNNIFAFGGAGCAATSRNESHDGLVLENNVMISDLGIEIYGVTAVQPISCRNNLYWDVSGEITLVFRDGRRGYQEWIERFGRDMGSLVADPLFEDAKNRNFLLKENSPAKEMGFVPLTGFLASGKSE